MTKRMDRVLIDCIILSILIATVMGGAFYVFRTADIKCLQ